MISYCVSWSVLGDRVPLKAREESKSFAPWSTSRSRGMNVKQHPDQYKQIQLNYTIYSSMRDVNSQIKVIHLFDFLLSSLWLHEGFPPLPVLKVFAFSTIKIPIITRSILELSCLLAKAMNYLHQSWEVGGSRHNHGHAIRMQKDSLRRQHALSGGFIPSKAEHINRELEGEKIYTPNFFSTTKTRAKSLLSGAKCSSTGGSEGKGRKTCISNSSCESFLPRQGRDAAAAGSELPKWKELFWEQLAQHD